MSERKVFRNLIEPSVAWNLFTSHFEFRIEVEDVPILGGIGRILAEDVFSPINVPPFDRVSMDGYAVRSTDLLGAGEDCGIELTVIGGIKAGHVFEGEYVPKSCVEVSTGAPMPHGFDSVVMVEYTERKGDKVIIYRPTTPSENIMSAGTDIKKGELVLLKRTRLTSRELSILAAMGYSSVKVFRRPQIAIFSTGDEVIRAGSPLSPGKIYDINTTSICTTIVENGGEPFDMGVIPDDYQSIKSSLSDALGRFDLILVSGGTSAGMGDMLYRVIDELGSPGLIVHGIKVKPGKPTILAVCNGTPIIGLPGYPASALSIAQLFVIPFLKMSTGLDASSSRNRKKAILKQRLRSTPGRHEFKPVNLVSIDDSIIAFPVPGGSGAITSIGLADGFIEIPEGTSFLDAEDEVDVLLISPDISLVDIQLVGLHDTTLNKILAKFNEKFPRWRLRFVATSSSAGLSSLLKHECHFASVLDSGQLDGKIEVVYSISRNYGFYTKREEDVNSFTEIVQKGLRFINYPAGTFRNKQINALIKEEGVEFNQITGVDLVSKTLTSSLGHILQGRIDVCFGEETAITPELKFIPLGHEKISIIRLKKQPKTNAELDFVEFLSETIHTD